MISKNNWVKHENGQPKFQKCGVYLTIPAARALVPVLEAAVEEAEAYEFKRVTIKRKSQPKKPVDSDGHIAAYLKQCGIRSPSTAGKCASGTSDAVGRGDEIAGATERGASPEHQSVGHSIAPNHFYSTTASSGASDVSARQSKPRAPRKQQPKPETLNASNGHPGRPRKV